MSDGNWFDRWFGRWCVGGDYRGQQSEEESERLSKKWKEEREEERQYRRKSPWFRCDVCRLFHAHRPMPVPLPNENDTRDPVAMTFSYSEGFRGGGECRLQPPVQVEQDETARFPIVADDFWCGQFQDKNTGEVPL